MFFLKLIFDWRSLTRYFDNFGSENELVIDDDHDDDGDLDDVDHSQLMTFQASKKSNFNWNN